MVALFAGGSRRMLSYRRGNNLRAPSSYPQHRRSQGHGHHGGRRRHDSENPACSQAMVPHHSQDACYGNAGNRQQHPRRLPTPATSFSSTISLTSSPGIRSRSMYAADPTPNARQPGNSSDVTELEIRRRRFSVSGAVDYTMPNGASISDAPSLFPHRLPYHLGRYLRHPAILLPPPVTPPLQGSELPYGKRPPFSHEYLHPSPTSAAVLRLDPLRGNGWHGMGCGRCNADASRPPPTAHLDSSARERCDDSPLAYIEGPVKSITSAALSETTTARSLPSSRGTNPARTFLTRRERRLFFGFPGFASPRSPCFTTKHGPCPTDPSSGSLTPPASISFNYAPNPPTRRRTYLLLQKVTSLHQGEAVTSFPLSRQSHSRFAVFYAFE